MTFCRTAGMVRRIDVYKRQIKQLVDGSNTLVANNAQLNSGASQLADGTNQIVSGVDQLTTCLLYTSRCV